MGRARLRRLTRRTADLSLDAILRVMILAAEIRRFGWPGPPLNPPCRLHRH